MSDKKWLLTGVKRTRVHEIRLLADSAEEAIALAKGGYRFSKVTSCEEDPPCWRQTITVPRGRLDIHT